MNNLITCVGGNAGHNRAPYLFLMQYRKDGGLNFVQFGLLGANFVKCENNNI